MFKISIELGNTESPLCNISRNIEKAQVLREFSIIVWYECTKPHRKVVEAVSKINDLLTLLQGFSAGISGRRSD